MAISKITSDAIDAAGFTLKAASGNTSLNIQDASGSPNVSWLDSAGTVQWQLYSTMGGAAGLDPLALYSSAGEKVRFQTGGGISFNGDTAAANALDDYEEGSWTPDIRRNDGTVSATFTVGTGTATYVKIGRVVHLKCWLHTISNGSSNGSSYWRVNGLPFTGTQYSGSASGYNSLTPNSLYIGDAGGNIILTSDTTPYTGSLLGTIMINITYETNS